MAKKAGPYVVTIYADGTRVVESGDAMETLLADFERWRGEEVIRQAKTKQSAAQCDSLATNPTPRTVDRVEPVEPPIGVVLTAEDLAALLKCKPESIAGMVNAGHIPRPHQLGDLQRWLRSEVDAWIAGGMKSIGRKRGKPK